MLLSHFFKKLTLFELLLAVLAVLQLIHFVVLFLNRNFPIPLLCGPIFWAMSSIISKRDSSYIKRSFLLALIPFFFFAIWRLLVAEVDMWNYLQWYTPIMLGIQIVYPIMIMLDLKRENVQGEAVMLLKQLMVLSLGISFFVCVLFLENYAKIDFTLDLNPIHTIALATMFSTFVMLSYLSSIYRKHCEELMVCTKEEGTVVNDLGAKKPLDTTQQELLRVMEQEKLYLDPKLTLAKLADYSSCSKTDISSFLSNHLGYTYYGWLASYRIKYARDMLDDFGNEYKLEAVAHASGFLSKTTFNRYFKEIVGVQPSSYREQGDKNQAVI